MADIKRRDLYYFPGYDVQGVQRYYRFLVRQAGWYARRFDVRFDIGPLHRSGIEGWLRADVTAHWPDGVVTTRYHFCNWRRDVLEGYKPPARQRYLRLAGAWARMLTKGHLTRLWRAAPRLISTLGLPIIMFTVRLVIVLLALSLFSVDVIVGVVAVIAAGFALYGLRQASEVMYEDFFANAVIYFEDRLSYRPPPAEGRLGLAVRSLCDHIAGTGTDADEVALVGHSYGAAPAIMAAQAIARSGQSVSVLTIGSIAPFVSFDPNETELRPAIAALLACDNVCWRDIFAPQDSLSFPGVAPIKDFQLPVETRITANFKVKTAIYDQITARRKIRKFRWNIMRMHFQFLMAVDYQGGYDYYRIALGPNPLAISSP